MLPHFKDVSREMAQERVTLWQNQCRPRAVGPYPNRARRLSKRAHFPVRIRRSVTIPPAPLLAIHLLGHLRLESRGEPITRPRRRDSERLLLYVLLNRHRQLERRTAAFELWPDVPADKALYNLRFQLYKLASDLPPAPEGRSWFARGDRLVQWIGGADAWLDVAEFESLASAPSERHEDTAGGAIERMRTAVALYQGDLLPEHDEPWLEAPRHRLRAAALRTLDALCDRLVDGHEFAEAVTFAQRRIALDPDEEHGYRQLMRAYAGLADSGALARTFEACANQMREAYGLRPSAETVALYDALIEGGESEARTDGPASPSGRARSSMSAEADAQQPATPSMPPHGSAGHGIPRPLTRFVGRQDEIVSLRSRLGAGRLITIVGPGGAGKTRLAIEVLRALDDAGDVVRWAELADLPHNAPVTAAIAQTIGLATRATATLDDLAEAIGDASMVLALDNCEHVLDSVRAAADVLLASCPGLHLLATSREPLTVPGEQRWPIAPLSVPEADQDAHAGLVGSAAVELFVDRASALDATWAPSGVDLRHIAVICRLLEGHPLAIEIAAARTLLLTPADLASQLAAGLANLGDADGEGRHDSLFASVRWSHDLLVADEQRALARLAVFPGGFDLAGQGLEVDECGAVLDQQALHLAVDLALKNGVGVPEAVVLGLGLLGALLLAAR